MLRRVATLAAAAASLAAAAVACSTFRDGDVTPGSDDGGSGSDAGADGLGPEGGSAADAASCDLLPPDGLFYEAHFDNNNCEGWQPIAQATMQFVPSPNRCGAGSCKVCSTGPGDVVILRTLDVDQMPGTFEARLELRGDTLTGSVNGGLFFFDQASKDVGFGQTTVNLGQGQWTPGQIVGGHTASASLVWMRLVATADAANRCYFIDEIRLGHY